MKRLLLCWVGAADLKGWDTDEESNRGPIAQAVIQGSYQQVVLLCNYKKREASGYPKWLEKLSGTPVEITYHNLSDPTDFKEIYQSVNTVIKRCKKQYGTDTPLTFHTSPGTPQMAAIWIILSASKYPAELIKSSIQQGVQPANLPFEISADYIPDLLREYDRSLENSATSASLEIPAFNDIIYASDAMKRVVFKAQTVALRSIPVLIEGASGTGKELFARAIHYSSARKDNELITVNCGAISPELVESELFGHLKGSFSGAIKDRKGYFEQAQKNTLFLDEIGELPLTAQVKLLRALQEGEITPVGSSVSRKVDVRVIAATNRNLASEITKGTFREDLFYRIAVAVIKLPPLVERDKDLELLIDSLLKVVNKEHANDPTYKHKKISSTAKNIMLTHTWPGNVRELLNTLHRAAVWSMGTIITDEDIQDALMPLKSEQLHQDKYPPLTPGFNIKETLSDVAAHYLKEALEKCHGNKTKAAKMLGLANYQTLTNWLRKYDIG